MSDESEPITSVKFTEPPPPRRQRYDWDKIATKLRRKPNEWALIYENDLTSLSTAIRIGGIKALRPEKGFEVRTTNNTRDKPRRCDMYLRYNPEKDTEKKEND